MACIKLENGDMIKIKTDYTFSLLSLLASITGGFLLGMHHIAMITIPVDTLLVISGKFLFVKEPPCSLVMFRYLINIVTNSINCNQQAFSYWLSSFQVTHSRNSL